MMIKMMIKKISFSFLNGLLICQFLLLPWTQNSWAHTQRAERSEARTQLRENNPNRVERTPAGNARRAQAFNAALGATYQISGAVNEMMQRMNQSRQLQQEMAQLQSLYPQPLHPSEVPAIFSQNGCAVLPARTIQLGIGNRCDEPISDPAQAASYAALQETAFQISNTYKNFSTDGNSLGGASPDPRMSGQGMACYQQARNNFEAQLRARVERLNQLKNLVDQRMAQFERQSEQDLREIQRGQALLTGKPAEWLGDIRFEDQFTDPACRSFLPLTDITQAAKGGFVGIKEMLDGRVSSPGNGAIPPSEMLSRAPDFEREIQNLSQRIGSQMSSMNLNDFDPQNLNLQDRAGFSQSPALRRVLEGETNRLSQQRERLGRRINQLDADPSFQNLASRATDPDFNLESQIQIYERDQTNNCLNSYLQSNFGGPQGLAGRLENPRLSRSANAESDNVLKNFITTTLANNLLSMEEKLKLIREQEARDSSELTFNLGKAVDFDGVSITASTRLRASQMINIFAQNCKNRFESVPNAQGYTPRKVIANLRDIRRENENLNNAFISEVTARLNQELINCPGDTASGVGHQTCSPDSLNPQHQNFCVRTARLCSSNMNQCLNKARKVHDRTRATQRQVAARYNANVEKFKQAMLAEFGQVNAFMETEARRLDGLFQGQGSLYNVPVGLDFSTLATDNLLNGIDPDLRIEDPKKYVEKMQQNLDTLIAQVEQQNQQIMKGPSNGDEVGGIDGLIARYRRNYLEQKQEWDTIARACQQQLLAFDQQQNQEHQQMAQQMEEQNEELMAVCRALGAYNNDPGASCANEAESLQSDVLKAAHILGDTDAAVATLRQHARICAGLGDNNDQIFTGENETLNITTVMRAEIFCNRDDFSSHELCRQRDAEINRLYNVADYLNLNDCNGNEEVCITAAGVARMTDDNSCDNSKRTINTITDLNQKILAARASGCFIPETIANLDIDDDIRDFQRQQIRLRQASTLGEVRIPRCYGLANGNTRGVGGLMDNLGQMMGPQPAGSMGRGF